MSNQQQTNAMPMNKNKRTENIKRQDEEEE